MKDNIAIASVIFTIVAVVLLVLIDPEPAARALDAVSASWFAPWSAAEAAHLEPTVINGSRGAPDKRAPPRSHH